MTTGSCGSGTSHCGLVRTGIQTLQTLRRVCPSLDVMYTGTQTPGIEFMLFYVGHQSTKGADLFLKGIVNSGRLSKSRFIAARLELLCFAERPSAHEYPVVEIWHGRGVQEVQSSCPNIEYCALHYLFMPDYFACCYTMIL